MIQRKIDDSRPELTKNKGLFVIEIPKMIGKQLIAKDVYHGA